MSNEKKQAKWRPNLFDIVIVLIGIAVMAVIVLVMRPAATNVSQTIPMQYTIELQNMPEGAWENVQAGDSLTDNIKNLGMGKVVSVSAVPYTKATANAAGDHVYQSQVPGYENVIIVVEANMSVTDSALITEGGYTVRVGGSVAAKGPCYAGTGYVIAVDRGEE